MPKDYKKELIQPPGKHNPEYECVLSSEIKDYISVPYPHLNPVQSDFVTYLEDDVNIVVAAPTSSGKTLCAELFTARAIKQNKRVLYIAPMKALTDEKYYEWTNISHSLSNNNIEILTGDFQFTEAKKKALNNANIIFLTPEMFNSKCRYIDNHEWLKNSVVIVDECHLISSKSRGDKLEIGLIQFLESLPEARVLLLSATIPNVEDFSSFVKNNTKKETIIIRSSYRPCQLNVNFVTFSDVGPGGMKMGYDQKEIARLEEVVKLVNKHKSEPLIVFTGAKEFGRKLSERLDLYSINHCFHNADLDRESRNRIENEFRNGDFNVLIATTTVAWGCGLKSTNILTNEGFKEISEQCDEVCSMSNEVDKKSFKKTIKKIVVGNEIKIKRLVTFSGLSISFTEDHKIPLVNGEEKQIKDIKIGDEIWVKNIFNENIKKEIPTHLMNESFFYLLGYVAGDGSCTIKDRNAQIASFDESTTRGLEIYLNDLNIEFGKNYIKSHNEKNKSGFNINIYKNNIYNFQDYIKYIDINERKIMDYNLLFIDNQKLLYALIAGIMDSDGGIDSNKICFYNTSKDLVNFFVFCMKRFGIRTSVKLRENNKISLIKNRNNKETIINGKKHIYEVIVGNRYGFEFFYNNIMPFMTSDFKKNKLTKIENRIYNGHSIGFCKEDKIVKIPRFKKTIEFINNVLKITKEEKRPLSFILKSFNLEKLPMRKNIFDSCFNFELKKINNSGRNRKFYYPNELGLALLESESNLDLINKMIETSSLKKTELIQKEYRIKKEIRDIYPEKVRFVIDEDRTSEDDIVYDLSIINDIDDKEEYHSYFANGILVHNCNTPARHVILSHTAFGLTEMDPSDIHQAMGRAGRFGYSDEGDAHILVTKRDREKEERRLTGGYEIKSTLNDINTMIFHILSYIDNGHIKNAQELYDWHEKTLASVQKARYGIEVFSIRSAQNVLDNLETRRMIKKDDEGNYSTTEMGQITARMYMSPLDVSDWFVNFSKLPVINPPSGSSPMTKEKLNIHIALALGKCFSWSNPSKVYISKAEQRTRTVVDFAQKLINAGALTWDTLQKNPHVKYAAIFYSLLQGEDIDSGLQSILHGLQQDLPRIVSTMSQVDERYGKYHKQKGICKGFGWGNDWDRLLYRLKYPGISEHLWELVSIDGVGQVLANKLYNEGIKNKKDFQDPLNHYKVRSAIGEKRAEKIFSELGIKASSTLSGPAKKPKKTTKKEIVKIKEEKDSLF